MDFSVIRRPKPPKKVEPPPPPLPPPPPPPPPPQRGPFSPYIEDLGRLERLKSVEAANCYRLNFDESPNQQFVSYHHYPVGGRHGANHHHHPSPQPRMALPPPDYHNAPPPRLGPAGCHCGRPRRMDLPPPDCCHHAPPPRLSPYQPDFHYGPPPPPPPYLQYHGSPAYSIDENPNACTNM